VPFDSALAYEQPGGVISDGCAYRQSALAAPPGHTLDAISPASRSDGSRG
jgi:hypothetical protein